YHHPILYPDLERRNVMDTNILLFWSFALTVCAFALFVHSLLLMRKLIHLQHLSWWKMLVVILSCPVGIWSMFVAFGGFSMVPVFDDILSGHGGPNFFLVVNANIDMAIVSCQVQMAIVVAVFIVSAYFERKMFPPVELAPQWVTIRENHLTR
ncbi:MAG: hypothetical protein ABI406_08540, partial [Ktedonobacteraceae bacterium]